MLQEKRKDSCVKLGVVIFFGISILLAFPFTIIILVIYLFKSDFDIKKSMKKYWLNNCPHLDKFIKNFKDAYEENKKNYETLKNDEIWWSVVKETEFKN